MRKRELALLIAIFGTSCDFETSPGDEDPGSKPPAVHEEEDPTGGVWLCSKCPEEVALKKGNCSECGRLLEHCETTLSYRCLEHPVIARLDDGICPVCDRALMSVAVGRVWNCPDHPETRFFRAGTCPNCREPLEEGFQSLPHGDHNPRHGGLFFMAADKWHHLEGALPEPGRFHLYVYDDFTEPLSAQGATGRIEVVVAEATDEAEAPTRTFPLEPDPQDGAYLMASLPAELHTLPLELTAFLRFAGADRTEVDPKSDEYRFDFRFEELSVTDVTGPTAEERAMQELEVEPDDPTRLARMSPEELVIEILARNFHVRLLIHRKRWDELYRPSLEAKDMALELQTRDAFLQSWDETPRRRLADAVRELVRGAWLVELHGDRGDGPKVLTAYGVFSEGIRELRALFPFLEAPGGE